MDRKTPLKKDETVEIRLSHAANTAFMAAPPSTGWTATTTAWSVSTNIARVSRACSRSSFRGVRRTNSEPRRGAWAVEWGQQRACGPGFRVLRSAQPRNDELRDLSSRTQAPAKATASAPVRGARNASWSGLTDSAG